MTAVAHARFQRLPSPGAESGPALEVQFNPTEYTLAKANQLSEIPIPGLDQPIIQFVRGQTETLSIELFFDSTEGGTGRLAKSVTERTDKFYDLIKIDPKTHAPPVLLFSWGGDAFPGKIRKAFRCVVASVRQQYTLFSPTGTPLRAKLTVELREYKSLSQQIHELNKRSADHTQAHLVVEGETITSVAFGAYGDPGDWRRIATANAIDDPLDVPPGTILAIPRGAA